MGRIEDALAKLQAQRAAGEAARLSAAPARPIGRVLESADPAAAQEHNYGGKPIDIDFAELRAHGLLAPDSEERKLAEEYRVIKRPLLTNASATRQPAIPRGNILMVGSAVAGEGKTFTCLNLCLSIANERDWSVVLVDGDCVKPHITRLFGASAEPGFMDLLQDPSASFDSFVMPTNVPRFAVMPAGSPSEHASELLASARMDALCAEVGARDNHRMIVFDSAPLLLTSEAPVLASHMGQVVLVVHASKTPQRAVLSACEKLDRTKALNLLLNQAGFGNAARAYGTYGQQSYDA